MKYYHLLISIPSITFSKIQKLVIFEANSDIDGDNLNKFNLELKITYNYLS